MAEVDTRQRGPRCKAKNGVGAARLPPHSPSMLSVLESLNSGPSTLHASQLCLPSPPACQPCLSPSFAPPISDQRPFAAFASSAVPRVRPLASLHPSNLLLSNPDPSLARTLIPRSSASVRWSRAHQHRDRPQHQSSTATARVPSNITSPALIRNPTRIRSPQSVRQLRARSPTRPSPSTFVNPGPAMCLRLPADLTASRPSA